MFKASYDKVLVTVDYEWKKEILTKSGIYGVIFENDIMRLDGAQVKGVVVALPVGVSEDHYALKEYDPLDIAELRKGDIIYFHFNQVTPDSRFEIDGDNKLYYTVDLSSIFCIIRDAQVIMLGGRILAEPIFDDEVDEGTNTKIQKTESGIVTKLKLDSFEQHNNRKARLAHIGRPLLGAEPVDIEPGTVFFYEKDADLSYEIEGKKYLVMEQSNIVMKEYERAE